MSLLGERPQRVLKDMAKGLRKKAFNKLYWQGFHLEPDYLLKRKASLTRMTELFLIKLF